MKKIRITGEEHVRRYVTAFVRSETGESCCPVCGWESDDNQYEFFVSEDAKLSSPVRPRFCPICGSRFDDSLRIMDCEGEPLEWWKEERLIEDGEWKSLVGEDIADGRRESREKIEAMKTEGINPAIEGLKKELIGVTEEKRKLDEAYSLAMAERQKSELDFLAARAENRKLERELRSCENKVHLLEMARREDRKAAKQEINGMTAFVGLAAGLTVTGVCVLAAPVWTAVLPVLATVGVMRKAGWL